MKNWLYKQWYLLPAYFIHYRYDSKAKDKNKAAKAIKSKMGPETTKQDRRQYYPFLYMMQSAAC